MIYDIPEMKNVAVFVLATFCDEMTIFLAEASVTSFFEWFTSSVPPLLIEKLFAENGIEKSLLDA